MAHRLLHDPDEDGWERSDFPIVCESCLGPNPYVRMQRIEFGGECHISGRPYTVFRWKPGSDARYKKTIICQEVAKAKNVCQVCLLDLDYNLPVQVRDSALTEEGAELAALPESDVGKEYALQKMSDEGSLGAVYTKQQANDTILRLQRTGPYYKRNQAQLCSFFVKGECKRGAECPYRHEMPTTGPLANQNIKDRYYGVNDPVANKMMDRVNTMAKLEPPADQSITTLYVGGLTPDMLESDIHEQFSPYGFIQSIRKLEVRRCAFVTYAERADAERAAEALASRLMINGQRCKLFWGKPQAERPQPGATAGSGGTGPAGVPPLGMLPPQVAAQMGSTAPAGMPYGGPPGGPPPANFFNLPTGGPGGGAQPMYPSQDPMNMGTSKRLAPGGAPPGDPKRQRTGPGGGPPPFYGGPPPMMGFPPSWPGQPLMQPPPGMPPPGRPPPVPQPAPLQRA